MAINFILDHFIGEFLSVPNDWFATDEDNGTELIGPIVKKEELHQMNTTNQDYN